MLWALSLPDNLRDELTAQEVAEAAWLEDDAVGATAQAEHLLDLLIQSGFPVRREKRSRGGEEITVYGYESSVVQANPVKFFAPLKKKYLQDIPRQDEKWIESLFWDLTVITPEAQAELQVNGGIFSAFAPPDKRTSQERANNAPPRYSFPHRSAASTKRVHKIAYGGEVVACDRWRDEFGEEIKNADQHFRIAYLCTKPEETDDVIAAGLNDARVVVCRPDALNQESRDALADMLAAQEMKKNCAAPNQGSLREYADGKRRDAIKSILKCQQDEFRRGKVLTQKGYGIPAIEVFAQPKEREELLAARILEKSYDVPLFSPKDLKKDFTDNDARKLFAGLFTKEPAGAEKDAIINFGPGTELTERSHPSEYNPQHSQAIEKIRGILVGAADKPINDIKTALCRAPYGLTPELVTLYLLALVRSGGWEISLNPTTQIQLSNGKPLPANRLTPHTLGLVKWNTQLERALLGARIIASVQKGWDEVLPFARVLDDSLKPAPTPEEEIERNEQLVGILTKLKQEVPNIESSTRALAAKLGGVVPRSFVEVCARLKALATSESYQQFDAAVRESYDERDKFGEAFAEYANARKLSERALELGQSHDYLAAACEVNTPVDTKREALAIQLNFEALFAAPHVTGAFLDAFRQWQQQYVHAYRVAHRAYYENLGQLATAVEPFGPRAIALSRLNAVSELGPPYPGTANITVDFERLQEALWLCPDAAEADVAGVNATCPKCQWKPDRTLPQAEYDRLNKGVSQGFADRFQRLKDTSISTILRKAGAEKERADLTTLLEIIQLADADRLANVMTEDLAAFLRQLLQEANIVQESVTLAPIIEQIGAIEEDRVDEAISRFMSLLRNAIKDAKAKHGVGKRVRIFLRMDNA
jgi:hypothetical protein